MKKKIKTFFTYLGVILLSLIMTVVICAIFLFFYRDGNIFGFMYLKRDEVLYAKTNELNLKNVSALNIESQNFDIKIDVGKYTDYIQGAMVNKVFGYTHKSKAQASFSVSYDEKNEAIVFDVVEPGGWISKKDCYIAIVIPELFIDKDIDINVKTQKGDILIGGNKKIELGQVGVSSTKGDINLYNINIQDEFNINLGSGLLYVDDRCTASDINVGVRLGSGKINLTQISDFVIKSLKIEEIKCGLISVLKAWEVVTIGAINGGGKIEIGQVVELDILTLDTDIKVGTLGEIGSEEALGSRVEIRGNGNVEVLRAYTALDITGHNGNVNIGTATSTVTISTNQGDVNVLKAYGNISVDSQYGTAQIQFAEDAPQYSAGGRILVAGTKNGHIIARGVQNANITIREKGRASLDYDLVRGQNSIIANKIGNINIVIPYEHDSQSVAIDLKVYGETMPNVEVGTVSSEQAKLIEGVYTLEVDNIYGSNIHDAVLCVKSTTGNIKIRSRDMINF